MATLNNLPTNPDFHIDATRPILTPSVGNGHESPVNLIDDSDIEVSQSTASNQPSWEDGGDPRWDFGTSSDNIFWKSGQTYDLSGNWAFSFVGAFGSMEDLRTTDLFAVPFALSFSSASKSRAEIAAVNSDTLRCFVQDDDGNSSFTDATISDTTVPLVVGGYIERSSGSVDLYLHVRTSVETVSSESTGGSVHGIEESCNLYIGVQRSTRDHAGGPIREVQFYEKRLSKSNIDRTVSALAKKHGYDSSAKQTTAGIRINNEYPANPDVHIEADQEVQDRADGDGVQRPLNLPADSDLEPSQVTDSEQPIWRPNNGEPYYEFTGGEWWNTPDAPTSVMKVWFAFVQKHNSSNTNNLFGHGVQGGQANYFLRYKQGNRFEINVDDGSSSTLQAVNIEDVTVKNVVVGTINLSKGEMYLTAKNNSTSDTNFTSINHSQLIGLTTLKYGTGRNAVNNISADMYFVVHGFGASLTQTQADNFRDHLAQKHGIA